MTVSKLQASNFKQKHTKYDITEKNIHERAIIFKHEKCYKTIKKIVINTAVTF